MEEMDGMEMMPEAYDIEPIAETYGAEPRADESAIVTKALKCIDEIYPNENTLNEGYLPTDAFINEAVRWVIDVVPSHELTLRKTLALTDEIVDNRTGIGRAKVADVGRIIYFKAADWKRPVFGVINENDPRYIQQSNKVLRGNPSRPIVALVEGKTRLEWYTTNSSEAVTVYHIPYSATNIPLHLEDLTAWKLAEIVLMSMHDTQGAAVCTTKVNEHLEILAL